MRQPERQGHVHFVVILTTILACLTSINATAADYFKPPEFAVPQGTTIIHAGTLLAVPGEAPRTAQSIIMENGRIVEIRDGYSQATEIQAEGEVRIVDLSDSFVMPGFIDLHVHLSGQAGSGSKLDYVTMTDADSALTAQMYARRTLLGGFTTVRDLGSSGTALFALRDAIKAGKIAGPKIIVAGEAITATGGHGDVRSMRNSLCPKEQP